MMEEGKFVVEIFGPNTDLICPGSLGHGELLDIVTSALMDSEKEYSTIRVSYVDLSEEEDTYGQDNQRVHGTKPRYTVRFNPKED